MIHRLRRHVRSSAEMFHRVLLFFFLLFCTLCTYFGPAQHRFAANLLIPQAGAQQELDWRYGIIEAYQAPFAARDLGVSWTRVTFNWADVQADGPESWETAVDETLIEAEPRFGREVVGLLIGIPEWARDINDLPQGLWLEHDDPNNLWANYVREAVRRYDGRITDWIIWNEPDIDKAAIAHTWNGSVDDFYQLQRVAYLVAKETNPDAVVHLPAFTYWADANAGREQYMARLLDRIVADPEAAQHNYYFDVATAHLYFQADQIYDLLQLFQETLHIRGLNKPLWLVETNAPPFNDPAWPVEDVTLAVTQEEQAAFIPQAVAAALAADVERIGVFKMQDTVDDRAANPEPFGLMRMDATTRLGYRTYATAIDYLAGVTAAERERWDAVGQFRLEQADRTTRVLFTRLPDMQTVEVPAAAVSALLVDMWGQKEIITPENGMYTVDLQQARCTQTIGDYCMIGGTVIYLIEAKDGGLPPEGLPAPLTTPPPTPTALPTAAHTPTTQPTVTLTAVPEATVTTLAPVTETAVHITQNPTAAAPRTNTPQPQPTREPTAVTPADTAPAPASTVYLEIGFVILVILLFFGWRLVKK